MHCLLPDPEMSGLSGGQELQHCPPMQKAGHVLDWQVYAVALRQTKVGQYVESPPVSQIVTALELTEVEFMQTHDVTQDELDLWTNCEHVEHKCAFEIPKDVEYTPYGIAHVALH